MMAGEVVASIAGEKSVVKMELYKSSNETECGRYMGHEDSLMREKTLMLGLVTSMVASQIWQLIATYLAWPVSGTHTIISALMGFTLVEKGAQVVFSHPTLSLLSSPFSIFSLFYLPVSSPFLYLSSLSQVTLYLSFPYFLPLYISLFFPSLMSPPSLWKLLLTFMIVGYQCG